MLASGPSQVINQPKGAEMVFLASRQNGSIQNNLQTNSKGGMAREVAGEAKFPLSTDP